MMHLKLFHVLHMLLKGTVMVSKAVMPCLSANLVLSQHLQPNYWKKSYEM